MRSLQPRKIPVASIQTPAHDRENFDAAWPSIVASVESAAAAGARLIVLPEATVPGYVIGTQPVPITQLDAAATDLAERAKRYGTTIVYGAAKIVRGITYNAAIAIGPDGREIGFAAKQFLWHFDRRWFAAGATLDPIETPVGKLGLLVCADGRIPSIAATLVERGADMLVMPTAWVTSGRDPRNLENVQADLMVNVRARENGVPFVAANKCGVELGSVAYCGKSVVVDAAGATLARASEGAAEIIATEIELRPREALAQPPATLGRSILPAERVQRARIAVVAARDPREIERFSELAKSADADVLVSPLDAACDARGRLAIVAGVALAAVAWEAVLAPRGLVAARLAGIDLFATIGGDDPAWHEKFARTRAAELRAYVIVFSDRRRAFVADPDGAVVCGTFDDYRLAAFAYDRARTGATQVAPSTDVLEGLRVAETIRGEPSGLRDAL